MTDMRVAASLDTRQTPLLVLNKSIYPGEFES